MITCLRIKGFKAWRDTGDVALAPITGLFGTNSSGKSSILHLLLLLQRTARSSDRGLALDFGDGQAPPRLGSFIDVLHRHDRSIPMGWDLTWTLDPASLSAEMPPFGGHTLTISSSVVLHGTEPFANSLAYTAGGVSVRLDERRDGNGFELTASPAAKFKFTRRRGRPPILPGPVKSYAFPDEARAYASNAAFTADFELAFERLMRDVRYLGPLREYPNRQYAWSGQRPDGVGERGERAIEVLVAAESRKQRVPTLVGKRGEALSAVIGAWLQKLGLVHSFEVVEVAPGSRIHEVRLRRTKGSVPVLLPDVGFGVSQVLPVIVQAFTAPPGSVVLLEQPEIHLHPLVQSGLADVLIDAWKRTGTQFIVESHSEHLLQRLQRRIAEGALETKDVRLYFARKQESGEHVLDDLQLDMFGNITNWPDDFFGDRLAEAVAMRKAAADRARASA